MATNEQSTDKKIAIKFLISNILAGTLIGTKGSSIKELLTISNARISVSGAEELYPGTSDRVVLISGSLEAVNIANTFVWEMIAQFAVSVGKGERNLEWSPRVAAENIGCNRSVDVSAKFSIPAAAGGIVLGKGGANIRSIAENSGAKVVITNKDDALFTQERILTITGETAQCIRCTELLMEKLAEQEEVAQFANKGTSYASPLSSPFGFPSNGSPTHGGNRGSNGGNARGSPTHAGRNHSSPGGMYGTRNGQQQQYAVEHEPIAETKITLQIPNDLIGNIFGRQGATMREIISLSGAKVVVSERDQFVEGTTNRLVTITGSPACAQTAHLFITQRLNTPSNAPNKRRADQS